MKNILANFEKRKLIHPPKWLLANLSYLTSAGSHAYGSNDDDSDLDVYGFAIPLKDDLFPHLRGEIPGFGTQVQRFAQWQESHINDADSGRIYDFQIYSIVKYFQLCMENNPNMLDSLFTSRECVLQSSPIAEMVRERRKLFLHKGCKFKLMGYSFSQLHKMKLKTPEKGSRRAEYIDKFGFDTKFASHLIRLVSQCEQLLTEGDLDLRRNSELLKSIRRGEWTEADVISWFNRKEPYIEKLYEDCKVLPHKPDEAAIKQLLIDCLEHHYGSLTNIISVQGEAEKKLAAIRSIVS